MAKRIKEFGKAALEWFPALDGQIRDNQKLVKELNQRREDLDSLNVIWTDLKAKYRRSKYVIFFIRYELMKRMIKSSVKRVRQLLNDIESRSKDPDVEIEPDLDYSALLVGKESKDFRSEIKTIKKDFEKKIKLIEQLGKDYRKSRNQSYARRYDAMREMIKGVFSRSSNVIE